MCDVHTTLHTQVVSESKGLNFFRNKTLHLRRLFDAKRNSMAYIAYSTRLSNAAVSSERPTCCACAWALCYFAGSALYSCRPAFL